MWWIEPRDQIGKIENKMMYTPGRNFTASKKGPIM